MSSAWPYDAARVVWTLLAPKEGGAKLKRECCGAIWPPSTPGGPKTALGLLTPFNTFSLSASLLRSLVHSLFFPLSLFSVSV
jgi:hypothetical protein